MPDFTPRVWVEGERLAAEQMNRIEAGIADAHGKFNGSEMQEVAKRGAAAQILKEPIPIRPFISGDNLYFENADGSQSNAGQVRSGNDIGTAAEAVRLTGLDRIAAEQARADTIAKANTVPSISQLNATYATREMTKLAAETDRIRRSRFGRIGTAGRPAVAFRIDHQLDPFIATFLPLFLARRLPFSIGLVTKSIGNPTATYEPTTATWADVHSKILSAGGEIWAHSRTHSNPVAGQTLYDEIAGSRADIEAQAIGVRGFHAPGSPATWGTFVSLSDYNSEAGRIIRENFPLYESDVRGTTRRMLPANGSFGDAHATIDSMSLATAKQWVDEAIVYGHGLEYMFHPQYIGLTGNISVADVTALLDYIVTLRDAGKIEVLTASGLAFADSGSSERRNVVPYGSFEGVTTATPPPPWAAFSGAAWTIQTDGGRTGPNYLRVPNTAGVASCVIPAPDFSMNGAPYEFRGWVRGTEATGTFSRARITVRTPRGNPVIRDIQTNVAQSTAWTFVRFPFTLPSDVTDIVLAVGRHGGAGSADWDDLHIVAV